MNKKKVVVVLGIHCAGKSTICNMLHLKGYSAYPEIANEIIKKTGCQSGLYADDTFDNKVWEKELSRDAKILYDPNFLVVIETWHLGNISYTKIRDPKLAESKMNVVIERLKWFSIFPIFLQIEPSVMIERANIYRQSKSEIYDFYSRLNSSILWVLENLINDYAVVDANRPIKQVYLDVESKCNSFYACNII